MQFLTSCQHKSHIKQHYLLFVLSSLFISLASISTWAANSTPIELSYYLPGSQDQHIAHLPRHNSQHHITLQDIDNLPAYAWQWSSLNKNHFGFSQNTLWIRLDIDKAVLNNTPILSIGNPNLESVRVYQKQGGIYHSLNGNKSFGPRAGSYFNLKEFPQEKSTIFIAIQNDGPLNVPIRLMSSKTLKDFLISHTWIFGVYFGLNIFAFLSNLTFNNNPNHMYICAQYPDTINAILKLIINSMIIPLTVITSK